MVMSEGAGSNPSTYHNIPADVFLAGAFSPFSFLLAAVVPCTFLQYKTNAIKCIRQILF